MHSKLTKPLKTYVKKTKTSFYSSTQNWATENLAGLVVYNLIILLLVLLHSAGYFHPFLPITINIITFIAMILAVLLLGARSEFMFGMAAAFLVFAGFLLFLGVRVWADRTMVYVFQAFCIGIVLMLYRFRY